jgi:preprotein translocase subunit SecF
LSSLGYKAVSTSRDAQGRTSIKMSADANATQQKFNHQLKEKNRVSNFALGGYTTHKFAGETISSEAFKGAQHQTFTGR